MSVLFKTLERLVLWHVEENNLTQHPMHRLQFGFKKGCSTEQALSKTVNIIEKSLGQGYFVLGVFCDIAGAFDNANLDSITSMMTKRGISSDIVSWYEHFLRERKVSANLGTSSASIKPGKGTPQGGVLSAIIAWNLIFDELLKKYDGSAIISIGFADDGTLLIVGKVPSVMRSIMNEALKLATDWATEHGLRFCPNKTSAILFTRARSPPQLSPLTMYGEDIPYVTSTKLLGVKLDSKLSWMPHIEDKIKTCKGALMRLLPIMRRTWSPQPRYTRWLYKDVILPILLYGCHLWAHKLDNNSRAITNRLQKLHRLGLLSIANVRKSTPTAALEIMYDIPPLHLLVKERALNTLPRLKSLQREGDWLPTTTGGQKGHLSLLSLNSQPVDDGTLSPPSPNFDQPFTTFITPKPRFDLGGYLIFTDGSLIEGQSGAGVHIKRADDAITTISERLPTCTVFQAELRAIRAAAEFCLNNKLHDAPLNFFVDSQAALKAISAPYIYDEEVKATVDTIVALSKHNHIRFQWIKAHVGYPGNEAADRAAKEGAFSNRWHLDIRENYATQKQVNRSRLLDLWRAAWNDKKDCRQSKFFLDGPDSHIWKLLQTQSAATVSQTVRFATGHTFMRRHNGLVKKGYKVLETHEVNCSLCEEEEETPIHLLQECPCLNRQRASLLLAWQLDTPPPFSDSLVAFIKLPEIRELECDISSAAID